ncbi:hypothetical protein P171DRAFT_488499 [Karstenula rhodostoma CBS 690.94]|uniref:Uncharacterized protein n=1 Tax=Karstenula rhodostoma CBS 690.94 TaxID=1392251 RepID=A0A9P4U873_9PLEO|nr:hypothetical protein P171DRAFT_488499 [Karstenula rhodostoma CBS 690.94]
MGDRHLPPPTGLADVDLPPPVSPILAPILPLPLPSLPAYEGQRDPGRTDELLHLDASSLLRGHENRLGAPWDYPNQDVTEAELKRRQAAWHRAYQDEQPIHPRVPDVQQPPVPRLLAISNLLNPAPDRTVHQNVQPAAVPRPLAISNLLNPAPDRTVQHPEEPSQRGRGQSPVRENTNWSPANHVPQAESSSAAAARPQQLPVSRGDSGSRSKSEPVLHANRHDLPLNTTLPRRSSFPTPTEDLSTFPPLIAEKLQYSAELSLSTACVSYDGPQYDLVQEDWLLHKQARESQQIMASFRSRHTANIEAAKIFVHRFWAQVMQRKQHYEAHIGVAGILTLNIYWQDKEKRRMFTSVFVRRKGSPGRSVEGVVPP